ncbi:MAG: hypothetical protein RKP20_11055 [Candidatus Competibacter sp.]|nr:hypothetical protein [Candidatus Competibacter sp.]
MKKFLAFAAKSLAWVILGNPRTWVAKPIKLRRPGATGDRAQAGRSNPSPHH